MRPVNHNADGDNDEAGGVDDQKHDHRVGGRIFLWIQFLQFFHGFQSQGGGGIVESEHIGRHVHEDGSQGGMSFRYVGKQAAEHRAQEAGQGVDESAVLADFHDAQPESQYARQS